LKIKFEAQALKDAKGTKSLGYKDIKITPTFVGERKL